VNRALSTAFGLVMVAAVALQSGGTALTVCGAASVAVLLGNVFRPVATLAVLASAAVVALGEVAPMLAALCGLSAAAYLVLRHTTGVTVPTVIGALGFTIVGLAAVALPLQLPWVPLAAPLVVLSTVVLASRPFWTDRAGSGP
jgi:hypothetical protein